MLAAFLVRLRLVHQSFETFDSTISHNRHTPVILCSLAAIGSFYSNYATFRKAVQPGLIMFRYFRKHSSTASKREATLQVAFIVSG
jgi:hypothetical protein